MEPGRQPRSLCSRETFALQVVHSRIYAWNCLFIYLFRLICPQRPRLGLGFTLGLTPRGLVFNPRRVHPRANPPRVRVNPNPKGLTLTRYVGVSVFITRITHPTRPLARTASEAYVAGLSVHIHVYIYIYIYI